MAMRYAYTLEEAREYLAAYKDAERELVMGQAKSYRIGTREFTALDLDEIRKGIEYFSNIIEHYSANIGSRRARVVTPRDL